MIACRETIRKVERLHVWDVARANKAPFAFGIEPRVPFLDKAFLQTSMSIDPQDKMVRKRMLLLLILTPSLQAIVLLVQPWQTCRTFPSVVGVLYVACMFGMCYVCYIHAISMHSTA